MDAHGAGDQCLLYDSTLSATFNRVCSATPAIGLWLPPGQGALAQHIPGAGQAPGARSHPDPAVMEPGHGSEEPPLPLALARFQLSEEYGSLLPEPLVGHGTGTEGLVAAFGLGFDLMLL